MFPEPPDPLLYPPPPDPPLRPTAEGSFPPPPPPPLEVIEENTELLPLTPFLTPPGEVLPPAPQHLR